MRIIDLNYCEENFRKPTQKGGLKSDAFAEVFASGNLFSGTFSEALTFAFSWRR